MVGILKYHAIVEDRRISEAVKKVSVLLDVEEVVEEVLAELDVDEAGYRVEDLSKGEVRVYLDLDRECNFERISRSTTVRVVCRGVDAITRDVYRAVALELSKLSVELLKPYLGGGLEYMALVLDQGVVAVVEGMQDKVVVPRIPGTIFACHTHPLSHAPVFSEKDVLMLLDLLSNRGIGGCVASSASCFTLYRRGLFVVDDYFKLLRLARERKYVDLEAVRLGGFRSLDGFAVAI